MKKLMIVDDEPNVILSVKIGLESLNANYTFIEANNGEECFNKLKQGDKPDLILLDIMMPGIDGWEVFDRLKENQKWKEIPIIFLTARTDDLARKAGKFMAVDYIEKPFEINDLKKRIEKVIGK